MGEARELRGLLSHSREAVGASHRAVTAAWRGPLSLFEERDARKAFSNGVPAWAVACICKARRLVDSSAELGDLGDVYDAQLQLAERDGRGIIRAPVLALVAELDVLTLQLGGHEPFVLAAREAFDKPVAPLQDDTPSEGMERALAELANSVHTELPISILRDRGRLGEIWRMQGDALKRVLGRRGERSAASQTPGEAQPENFRQRLLNPFEALLQAEPELFEDQLQSWIERDYCSGASSAPSDSSPVVVQTQSKTQDTGDAPAAAATVYQGLHVLQASAELEEAVDSDHGSGDLQHLDRHASDTFWARERRLLRGAEAMALESGDRGHSQ